MLLEDVANVSPMPAIGDTVTVIRAGKKFPAQVTTVGSNTFEINSEPPFNVVKRNPMGGWRLANDIEHSPVIVK